MIRCGLKPATGYVGSGDLGGAQVQVKASCVLRLAQGHLVGATVIGTWLPLVLGLEVLLGRGYAVN